MTTSSHRLQPLLAPRSIAIVGASKKRTSTGWKSWKALDEIGYDGDVYLVNPRYDEIDGVRCYPDIASIEAHVDHSILAVANARLEAVFDQTIDANVPAATIFGSCYLQGDSDPPLLNRLQSKARDAGLLVCGGNGAGYINHEEKVQAVLAGARCSLETGPVAMISQSGSIHLGMIQTDGRLTFNLAVTSGQEITVSAADYMDYVLQRDSLRAIALAIETIRDPEAFYRSAEKAFERRVPVIVLKFARTAESVRMAQTHSGALAGDNAAHDAVFRKYGVLRVHDVDEMIGALQLAIQPRPFVAGGIVAITDSGGEREHLVDLASDHQVQFARISDETTRRLTASLDYGLEPVNPLDAWGTAHDYVRKFLDCWDALMNDPECAAGLWVADLRDIDSFRHVFVDRAAEISRASGRPMCFANCVPCAVSHETARRLYNAGIPLIDGLDTALAAMKSMFLWRDHRPESVMRIPEPPEPGIISEWRARLMTGAPLGEFETLSLARDFGMTIPKIMTVGCREEVEDVSKALTGPVVLKTAMPGIQHKSDVGGVRLGLACERELMDAWHDMDDRLGPCCTIAEMCPPGVELVFGIVRDAQFGTLVLVGAGGLLTEHIDDTVLAVPPFDSECAHSLLAKLAGNRLLDGFRGRPPADRDAVCESLARFSVLAATLGDLIAEFDLNPVIAGPDGAVAVDGLAMPVVSEREEE